VPAAAWDRWFGEPSGGTVPPRAVPRTLVAAFALPGSAGQAAICVFEDKRPAGTGSLCQAALKWWPTDPPDSVPLLHAGKDAGGRTEWALTSAWADPDLRSWLYRALSAGASLRSEEWEWLANPERASGSRDSDRASAPLHGRRHDAVLLPPDAVAVVYRQLTRGGQPELDLLRHLERVPGLRLAATVLGSAIIRSPTGQRSASAILEDIDPTSSTMRAGLLARLAAAFARDTESLSASLDDVRAVGTITRELHASLGRPLGHTTVTGAVAATQADLERWVARAWSAITRATVAYRAAFPNDEPTLASVLGLLPEKLQGFADAAASAPGLLHRIHGNLRLDAILIAPQRQLRIVDFDGETRLGDAERLEPQSPLRDVAQLLMSLSEVAADAVLLADSEPDAVEQARLWTREARRAYLDGYGSGGGALHALIAIFELELGALHLTGILAGTGHSLAVASHTLQRLSRTAG
jgi:hypothetical protein